MYTIYVDSYVFSFTMNTVCFMLLLQIWTRMDHLLYGITAGEVDEPQQFTRHIGLQLGDFSDLQAHKMTHSYHDQLFWLYRLFDLDGFLLSIETCINSHLPALVQSLDLIRQQRIRMRLSLGWMWYARPLQDGSQLGNTRSDTL